MAPMYGFQLRNGYTIEVEADGMREAIKKAEAEGGTFVIRGCELAPGPHRPDIPGTPFTVDDRAGIFELTGE